MDVSLERIVYPWIHGAFETDVWQLPPAAAMTACFPSVILGNNRIISQFAYLSLPGLSINLVFNRNLVVFFEQNDLDDIVFRMAGISWTVPIVNHQLHGGDFSQFVNVMDLRHFDMVLATLTREFCS